ADYRIEPVEYRTLDEEQVLVLVSAYGRGKASGVELSESTRGGGGAVLFRIRDGRVVRMDAYFDRDHPLADPGLAASTVPDEPTTLHMEEITRKNFEALNRGDIDAALSAFRPDAVWDASAVATVEGGTPHEGLAAIRELLEEWIGSFEDYEVVREEFRDLGNGVTLTVSVQKGRPLGSIGFVQL